MALRLDSSAGDRFLSGTGVLGCALALLAALGDRPAEMPADATRIGKVESRMNTVRRRLDGTLVWNSIGHGEPVFESDAVFADEGSAARLVLDDGSWIDVGPKTLVVVERRRAGAEGMAPVSIELVRGSVEAASGSSPIAIRTGEDSVLLGGSTQAALRSEAGEAAVEIAAGTASVSSKAGSVALAAGERSRIGHGAPKVERSAIVLEAPKAGARLVTDSDTERVTFRWKAPPGAGATLEIARDAFFRRIEHVAKVSGGSHVLHVAPGVYHWRIRRGPDNSPSRLLVVLEQVRPVLFQPRVGESIYQPPGADASVAFSWTAVPDASSYELELRAEAGASVHAKASRPAWIHDARLAEGRHCARVRAGGGQSGWSEETCFQVVAASRLPAPRLVTE